MPRTVRKKSKSGIYHIIMRGINQQIIFEDGRNKCQGDGVVDNIVTRQ
jgi:putative transposase